MFSVCCVVVSPQSNRLVIVIVVVLVTAVVALLPSVPESESTLTTAAICQSNFTISQCDEFMNRWFFVAANNRKTCIFYEFGCVSFTDNVNVAVGNSLFFESQQECESSCKYAITNDSSVTNTLGRQQQRYREPELVLEEVQLVRNDIDEHTFQFARKNAFIELDGKIIDTFQLRLCRQISFQFRTRLAHGLLVYHNVKVPDDNGSVVTMAGNSIELESYALYVIVQQGQLKVVHVFGKHSTELSVGQGLNRDRWHAVSVRIDVHAARILVKVDNETEEIHLKGLHAQRNYGVTSNLKSIVQIGGIDKGLSSEEKLHGVKYVIESFLGCIRNVKLSAGKSASDLLEIAPLIASGFKNVETGCLNRCRNINENLCFKSSKCVNHYDRITCDCYGTRYESEHCDVFTATVLTLRGSSFVSYRLYDWKDRVHAATSRISLMFKTRFDRSVLFYASGAADHQTTTASQFIAASIINRSVFVQIKCANDFITAQLGDNVTDNRWYNLTIVHDEKKVRISLELEQENEVVAVAAAVRSGAANLNDTTVKEFDLAGDIDEIVYFYLDPEIWIGGGGPDLGKKPGLLAFNCFVGSLKYVFFNDISILYELRNGNPRVHYIGMLGAEFTEIDIDTIPLTFPFASSHIWWPRTVQTKRQLQLKFDFSSNRSIGVLVSGDLLRSNSSAATKIGFWELRIIDDDIRVEFVSEIFKNYTRLLTVKNYKLNVWNRVCFELDNSTLRLTVGNSSTQTKLFATNFELGDKIIIGSGFKINTGFVGCMKDIVINDELLDPRTILQNERLIGDVSLDNCQFIDPCKRPNTCEHGGKCSVKDDKLKCNCKSTGYIGKNCHFAKFRKSCEELALLGHTKPDVYLIDIDGNGPFPPAHVRCEFQSFENATKTIVEHNLPSQVDVRSPLSSDFQFTIKYREFTAQMLQELIQHSLNCSQYIRYDCFKAPLHLYSATRFVSSANLTIDYLGEVKRGSCPCAEHEICTDVTKRCHCDANESKWSSDEGYFSSRHSLGITQMIFVQQPELAGDSQGRITLGPLECVETNTQKYVVTFTTSQSYIEVPGWRKGDLAFSFRTTGEQAILLYHPPIRANYPSFMVTLKSDFQLTFNFTLNTGQSRELVIRSERRLNAGDWHKLWIDYNRYHVRFMINTEYEMIDLKPEEEFGPFEGSMFVGGAPLDMLKKSAVKQGLIGCFRGLVVNQEILDIYSYMSVHLSEIIKDCRPSCVSNPCQNGGVCKELWSTFQCLCSNKWAHSGTVCEHNINAVGITLMTPDSQLVLSARDYPILKSILTENILINFRTYDPNVLVFYANDHLNNFVQLFLAGNGSEITFLFNYANTIVNVSVGVTGRRNRFNNGASNQIAIIRMQNQTVLFVNSFNRSVPFGVRLLDSYSNRPWTAKDRFKEILGPQRPPVSPMSYFQLNLGGYDKHNLIQNVAFVATAAATSKKLEGFVGCIRGFKIADQLLDLPAIAEKFTNMSSFLIAAAASAASVATAQVSSLSSSSSTLLSLASHGEQTVRQPAAILGDCKMKCDDAPCKNQGVCIDNFRNQAHLCNCELTSYYGEFCSDEKGAEFSGGESLLIRNFVLQNTSSTINFVKVQLAFSSHDIREKYTVLLLVFASHNYYLLVALTPEGYLTFKENRYNVTYGAIVTTANFYNNARHSVYYKRTEKRLELIVDRRAVNVSEIFEPELSLDDGRNDHDRRAELSGENQVQIGGLNTSDPRFAIFKGYSGCLSNVFIEVNDLVMRPLEEYMLFTKTGSEKVKVLNSHGVRSAQCNSNFDAELKTLSLLPTLNISQGIDKTWIVDPPKRQSYEFVAAKVTKPYSGLSNTMAMIFASVLLALILMCTYQAYRSERSYRRHLELAIELETNPAASNTTVTKPIVGSLVTKSKTNDVTGAASATSTSTVVAAGVDRLEKNISMPSQRTPLLMYPKPKPKPKPEPGPGNLLNSPIVEMPEDEF